MVQGKDISDIIRALYESGFEEAEIRLDDLYIRVSNQPDGETLADQSFASDRAVVANRGQQEAQRLPAPGPAATALRETGGVLKAIRSPTLGTFYRAPSPGAPPFVKVGDRVEVGQTIGIVEVMKLFNAVEADVAGTVAEIQAEDGVLVEHDQALMSVRVG